MLKENLKKADSAFVKLIVVSIVLGMPLLLAVYLGWIGLVLGIFPAIVISNFWIGKLQSIWSYLTAFAAIVVMIIYKKSVG